MANSLREKEAEEKLLQEQVIFQKTRQVSERGTHQANQYKHCFRIKKIKAEKP